MDILRTHPMAVIAGVLQENPFFVPPDEFLRELRALQNRLYGCTKFDKLIRYRCANLFFLVLPEELFRDPEIPVGWGTLVESNGALTLARKPIWHETTQQDRIRLLHRIAVAGTRALNRNLHDPGVFLQPL